METNRSADLTKARWIATLLYTIPLLLFPLVARFIHVKPIAQPEVLRILGLALLVVGVFDYGVSLFLEQKILPQPAARPGRPSAQVFTAAIVVASIGASLACYGLLLTLLGAPGWGAALYVLCAVHGLHLLLRWPRYEEAAQQAPE